MTEAVGLMWMIFQPILFGLIGAAVRIEQVQDPKIVGKESGFGIVMLHVYRSKITKSFYFLGFGVAIIAAGLVVRCSMAFIAVCRSGLNLKEQIFVSLAWIPKATVQVNDDLSSSMIYGILKEIRWSL